MPQSEDRNEQACQKLNINLQTWFVWIWVKENYEGKNKVQKVEKGSVLNKGTFITIKYRRAKKMLQLTVSLKWFISGSRLDLGSLLIIDFFPATVFISSLLFFHSHSVWVPLETQQSPNRHRPLLSVWPSCPHHDNPIHRGNMSSLIRLVSAALEKPQAPCGECPLRGRHLLAGTGRAGPPRTLENNPTPGPEHWANVLGGGAWRKHEILDPDVRRWKLSGPNLLLNSALFQRPPMQHPPPPAEALLSRKAG